ncbi:hypothetical protein F1188_19450 [Roseospira marina]|uniref:Antirepressor protein C-terminal domain-containing protein n=1 Tax=Roseospira marina TaxID=140057 RepID=A0A5M6I7K9_9PROT|nr:hypothetical protein [Roseospira marina]KAA5603719.1 hypothetical protein F1188_19450 [Roseospira marina]MBB4316124.1 hypothetical protein [Roseospira marina]MBB5089322.1 hypothetical protein [Roseospira marina]
MTEKTLTPLSVTDLDMTLDEPRILDLRLAERLGFSRPRDIRPLIESNAEELRRYGILVCANAPQTSQGGRPTIEYHLNQGQCLLVCMFSRTPIAADVRQEVITVFLACQYGEYGRSNGRRMNPRAPIQAADIVARLRKETDPTARRMLHSGLDRLCREIGTPTPPLDELGRDAPPLPDVAAPFFAGLGRLTELGVRWNHARRSDRMAVNLKEAAAHFTTHRIRVVIDTPLRDALKACQAPAFLGIVAVNSTLTGKTVKCWMFGPPDGAAEPIVH